MDKEMDRLQKKKDKAYRGLLIAKERYDQAEQAWLMCLQHRLFTWKRACKGHTK